MAMLSAASGSLKAHWKERIPVAPTVGGDLGKGRCAQRLPAFS
jgi:hypothetical protein